VTATGTGPGFRVTGVSGLPEIAAGDDLAALIADALAASGAPGLADGDIVVVTS
jgi:coenzyme F420-0:L-glutamate ligase/coenzyme F420-1:gamma-L-glutamate ligase